MKVYEVVGTRFYKGGSYNTFKEIYSSKLNAIASADNLIEELMSTDMCKGLKPRHEYCSHVDVISEISIGDGDKNAYIIRVVAYDVKKEMSRFEW